MARFSGRGSPGRCQVSGQRAAANLGHHRCTLSSVKRLGKRRGMMRFCRVPLLPKILGLTLGTSPSRPA
jgi:hypothetical protein